MCRVCVCMRVCARAFVFRSINILFFLSLSLYNDIVVRISNAVYRVVVDLFVAGTFSSVCLLVESCRVLEILINLMEVLECVCMYIWALYI